MSQTKFSVAICGGGVAGLAAAISLVQALQDRNDIQIHIYEAAAKFSEIGAAFGFLSRPWSILSKLGLADDLGQLLDAPPMKPLLKESFEMRKSDFAEGVTFYKHAHPAPIATFHRAHFLDVMLKHVDMTRLTAHNSKRLVSYAQTDDIRSPIELCFEDGSTAYTDVLIGADGIHSPTRHALLKEAAAKVESAGGDENVQQGARLRNACDALWSGTTCYRAVFPSEKLKSLNHEHRTLTRPVFYTGKEKHIVALPIARGTLVNISAFVSFPDKAGTKYDGRLSEERTKEELLEHYKGWEEEVQQLLQCVSSPTSWVINEVGPLSTFTSGRVAIIGDAAHAMTPHQGSGAGQAIEDAYILSAILAHPSTTLETLPQALKIYEEVRLPFANDVVKKSAAQGRLYEFIDPEAAVAQDFGKITSPEASNFGLLWNVGHIAAERWKWAWTTSVDDDHARAMKMVEERLAHYSDKN